ncbi:MAG: RraA family protein [Cytophagales bacterium]|uniref:RraA family protein n=1 Tax=Cyclobacterium marinum TaxID=104 RepID=UPI0030D90DD9|nr:RraA family protein [Cytophagales bacterium]|tara:strand:- start:10965 stop:11708 length:744 start_codon:yes stop_codon:yes gene_type:complete
MSVDQYKKEVGMMNLEKLIEVREGKTDVKFPISDVEILSRYEKIYTGAINDVLREFTLLNQSLPIRIKALREYHTVAGIAFTVKSSSSTRVSGEMKFRAKMLDEMHPNSFVIYDTSGDEESTSWGGVMTATAKEKGVKAACIDGGIRDTHQILKADFPVFYKYRSSNGSLGRCLITDYQVPIQIDKCFIKPGDVVLGDADGVLVVPREIAYDVLVRAEEIKENERKIFGWVKEGQSAKDISDKGGYF